MAHAPVHDAALSGWSSMPDEAKAGTLKVSDEVLDSLIRNCSEHIHELEKLKQAALHLTYLDDWNALGSAAQLSEKYKLLAVGDKYHSVDGGVIAS